MVDSAYQDLGAAIQERLAVQYFIDALSDKGDRWPGLDSRSRCHMWVEFVVGSRPCSQGFSPGTPVFLPP